MSLTLPSYLFLEYVDGGDMFGHITRHGRLSEEGAITYFRQMMGAISYCHSFNICHRDLKPENILVTTGGAIKIADFSMAALHQTDAHKLATACGSPHYAAPELLSHKTYKGDKADIWSLGCILFAMLAGSLPFDHPDQNAMLDLVRSGEYLMPEFLSLEAKDLIRRLLQVKPARRITIKEMWRHPLILKYSYMDDYEDSQGRPSYIRNIFGYEALSPAQLDPQLLRQMQSLWHTFSEEELVDMLTSPE
jgi:serine/threonine protein kinase